MSTQPAPALHSHMSATSVIKHYKKQLIYRQHDVPEVIQRTEPFLNEVGNTRIYDFVESEKGKKNKEDNGKKVRKKRKNRNCRGQFRHEAMELIKLGMNPTHTLCKTKDPLNPRPDKPPDNDRSVPSTPQPAHPSVIQTNYVNKPILETPTSQSSPFGHALPQMVPERRISHEFRPPVYRSPLLPEYHMPVYPLSHPYPPPMPFHSPPPPPPYTVPRSPPRPVPRPLLPQPVYQKLPFSGRFPVERRDNGFHMCEEGHDRKKRRMEEGHPVVAAIDLTMDAGEAEHKCKCECGKMYPNGGVTQEVIITVKDRENSQVPSTYIRGKMVNGVFQLEQNSKSIGPERYQNGVSKGPTPVRDPAPRLPPLFRIDDLLAKKKDKEQENISKLKKLPVPNRVIMSPRREEIPRPKDYSVSTIMSASRRQSVEVDTISISSSSSESVLSPRPDKNIPHGKLFYYKNSFIRYFDETQKKLFIDSITSGYNHKDPDEVIRLPSNAVFSSRDSLTVEEYVSEMTLVERFIPKDFFLFYKFVTGYQICNNNLPVSFLTFLKVYNTNGLKTLLERYIHSLKQN